MNHYKIFKVGSKHEYAKEYTAIIVAKSESDARERWRSEYVAAIMYIEKDESIMDSILDGVLIECEMIGAFDFAWLDAGAIDER